MMESKQPGIDYCCGAYSFEYCSYCNNPENQTKNNMDVENINDQPFYHHLRHEDNTPYATICVVAKDNKVGVGASITSEKDQFEYKLGRAISTGRAKKALHHEKSSAEDYFYFEELEKAPEERKELFNVLNKFDIDYPKRQFIKK